MSVITPDTTGTDGPAGSGFPSAAPDVVASAVESLTSRLRKKLDTAVRQYAAVPVTIAQDGSVVISCGEDATVTLAPGPSGAVTAPGQATCTCLLAPRCLHRAAVLVACPVAEAAPVGDADAGADGPAQVAASTGGPSSGTAGSGTPEPSASATTPTTPTAPTNPTNPTNPTAPTAATDPAATTTVGVTGVTGTTGTTGEGAAPDDASTSIGTAQIKAAEGLWKAAASVLAAGVPAAGAVPQAELLRAAHTARLAGLYRSEAAALRVVRGLRAARARSDGHRLADLTAALRELLLTTSLLATARPDPALIGTGRRAYQPGSGLRVHGICREPVISATGYGGVVTHVVTEDGRWFSVADVKPGGPARARDAATAPVAVGGVALDHAGLARGGLIISGATISPDGRLGSGKGVRAIPIPGVTWSLTPTRLFGRTLSEAAAERIPADLGADPESTAERARELIGCDLMIVGAAGDQVLALETPAAALTEPGAGGEDAQGLLVRLTPANRHPDLAHTANLRQLAARPGLRIRVVGRLDPDRAATLTPLAVGPVPNEEATLRLPQEWLERADLGYDRLQGAHFPPAARVPPPRPVRVGPDPLADSPLWRVRRVVELAVAGGRRAVAEPVHADDSRTDAQALRRAGFRTAADLATALGVEADRRTRDVFGRLDDADPRRFASAWLAVAVHLAAAERVLIRATWQGTTSQG